MEFDLETETKKLRNRSALTAHVVILFLSTIVLGVPISWLGFLPEFRSLSISWIPLSIGGAILLIGGFFSYLYSRKIRQLITTGEVVIADLQSTHKLQYIYVVTLNYEFANRSFDKSLFTSAAPCGGIEGVGFALLVVSPDDPTVAEPLYRFAVGKELFDIATGKSGLTNSAT